MRLLTPMVRAWKNLPQLIRFLIINCLIGISAGWMLLAMLIATNAAGLKTLIFESASPCLPLLMLAAGFAVTFGSAAMGAAVMALGREDDDNF